MAPFDELADDAVDRGVDLAAGIQSLPTAELAGPERVHRLTEGWS